MARNLGVVAADDVIPAVRPADDTGWRGSSYRVEQNTDAYYRMADVTIEVREEETPLEIVERLLLELPKSVLESARRVPWRTIR